MWETRWYQGRPVSFTFNEDGTALFISIWINQSYILPQQSHHRLWSVQPEMSSRPDTPANGLISTARLTGQITGEHT
jgi:hypothetical protein